MVLAAVALLVMLAAAGGIWITSQAAGEERHPRGGPPTARRLPGRDVLLAALQPVKLRTCELARFGEEHDGGYLLCGNLLANVQSAYSYGISGYDGWGCEVSTAFAVPVHQYDCFNTTEPTCPGGRPVFHAECIGGGAPLPRTDAAGRVFDSLPNQITKNGDAGKTIVVKMDVEGAEWESVLATPDAVLERIDQMVFEFHGVERNRAIALATIGRLKRFFHIAHLHFNNYSCQAGIEPFPAWAYEVTFVNKRLDEVASERARLPHPLDTPNNPGAPDCQAPPLRH